MIFLFFAIISSIKIGCKNKNEREISQEEIELVRTCIDAMQKDLSSKKQKAYETSFTQKHKVEYTIDDDYETASYSYDYDAQGKTQFSYVMNNANVEAFEVEGKMLNNKFDDIQISGTFAQYNSTNVDEYIINFKEFVIPSLEKD